MEHITSWKKEKWLVFSCSFLTVLAVCFSMIYYYMLQNTVTRYHVFIGTERVGVISDPRIIEDWLVRKKAEVKLQYPTVQTDVRMDDLHYITERAYKATFDNDAIVAPLERKTRIVLSGVQIRIDGKRLGYVKDEVAANQVLNQYKHKFDISGELQSSEFIQKVELSVVPLRPEDITSREELLTKIEAGDVQPIRYQVQSGDCISCIAYKFHITQQTIYDNNPSLKGTLIKVGQELVISAQQPLLTVKTVEKKTEIQEIAYDTQYVEEPSMKAGTKQVIMPGVNGMKRVTYLTTWLNGKWIEEAAADEMILLPVTQEVVMKGTKIIPGVGTGSFAWPVYQAQLTSEYGKRWGAFHPGTDMVSKQSGIMAADHGIITFAGWKSGYGNCIIIDHQNGYSTLYGHLSKILVSDGETVQKGDKIGIMGSTGNATGVHLHFEVRIGEKQENPLRFLGKNSD